MSTTEQNNRAVSPSDSDDDRSQIRSFPTSSRYRVGDSVKVINSNGTRAGPYYIATVVSTKKYTLSDGQGQPAQGGRAMSEGDLEAA